MEAIINFLKTYSYPNGDGDGSGNGNGNGSGNGYGDGSGNGNGDGELTSLNGQQIYIIDNVQTIITSVKNNIAKGFIVNNDLSTTPCYIAKVENKFAHGKSVKDAVESLRAKLLISKPIEQRIVEFKKVFKSVTKKYHALDFYKWHYLLTGSCDTGRKSFCQNNNIDLEKDRITVVEFINLTRNSYGSDVILHLEKSYEK